jgi:flagellar hook-length control protein FliK
MNAVDSLLHYTRQASAEIGPSHLGYPAAHRPSSGGFQERMEQAKKNAAPAQESAHTQKASSQCEASIREGAPVREEEEDTPLKEEIILPQDLSAIPMTMPLETIFRPEVQPLEESLQIASIPAVIRPEDTNPASPRENISVWTPEGGQTDGHEGKAEQIYRPVDAAPERVYTQTHAVRTETTRTEIQKPAEQAGTQQDRREDTQLPPGVGAQTRQPIFGEVESAPVKVGEPYLVDTQAQDMDISLADGIRRGLDEGARQIEIRLTPEHLGTLTIQLTQSSDGTLQVVLHAENSKAAGLLTQHLDGLHQTLQGLGQSQVHVEVQRNQESTPAQQQFRQADPDGRGQRQQNQQQRQDQGDKNDDFLHQLRLGLIPLDEAI